MEQKPEQEERWEAHDRVLARHFESWRAEFREILESHRREIQNRLERIEQEIEKKSDKENVDLLVGTLRDDLRRHAEEIKAVSAQMQSKMGIETMWKVISLVLAVGSAVGGVIGFMLHVLAGRP